MNTNEVNEWRTARCFYDMSDLDLFPMLIWNGFDHEKLLPKTKNNELPR